MPERDDIPIDELKRFLKLERLQYAPPGQGFPRRIDAIRKLRLHNAEEVLAAVELIEKQATPSIPVRFPAQLADELKTALPQLTASAETVERMGDILDRLQDSVSPGQVPRASAAFYERHEASEKLRARQAEDSARHRR
jgi:hypothetical protein